MSTPESVLLRHIYARSVATDSSHAGVLVGPGDDCAVVRVEGDLLLTVDQLVEGRHYDAGATPIDLVARKAVARSVSDIAAMGGTALAALATGALRDSFDRERELFDAMHDWGERFGCPLIGGDIARVDGPTVLTCAVLGRAHPTRGAVLRSGARVGDGVFVTGSLGGSFASGRHLTFTPRVREGRELCDALGADLRAMMDLSDGLGRDAARLADASGVCVEIEASAIPMHEGVADWRAAAGEGEDYELLFASSREPPATLGEGTRVTRIGRVVERAANAPACVIVTDRGERVDAGDLGWEHRGA
ncbi:MAG: thiamine-phosphate kinase [Phycisphaeraceae bacterium]|nr:thiamine-phosphate kinase [Phycisphaeraceae bacterium]